MNDSCNASIATALYWMSKVFLWYINIYRTGHALVHKIKGHPQIFIFYRPRWVRQFTNNYQ